MMLHSDDPSRSLMADQVEREHGDQMKRLINTTESLKDHIDMLQSLPGLYQVTSHDVLFTREGRSSSSSDHHTIEPPATSCSVGDSATERIEKDIKFISESPPPPFISPSPEVVDLSR